jgi:alpha-tubulin suppressor-like RCC1 family protein
LGIETLACAGWYTLGLTYSGDVSDTAQLTTKVYAWGESAAYGMAVKNVGLKTPTLIMKDMHVINIFTGAFAETNFAQTRDGKMYVWGSNSRNAYFGKLAVKETYTSRHEESDRYHVVKKPTLFPPLCNLPIRDFFVGNASCFLTLETRKKHKQFKIDTSAFGDVKIQCL